MRGSITAAGLAFVFSALVASVAQAAGKGGRDAGAPDGGGAPLATSAAAVAMTPLPDQAWARLRAGNDAFAAGHPKHPHQDAAQRKNAVASAHPVATVLSCADANVPPEIVFDQGIGDLFDVRVDGNFAETDEMGSIEIGVDQLGTPLLVVLGHADCSALGTAIGGAPAQFHVPELIDRLKPGIDAARRKFPAAAGTELIVHAARENVLHTMGELIRKSPPIRDRMKTGRLQVIGGVYDGTTGAVDWIGRHPEELAVLVDVERHAADDAPPMVDDAGVDGGLVSSDELVARLGAGNANFVAGKAAHPHQDNGRLIATAEGQHPMVTVLSCADSTAPPEVIFDQGLGDLYVARVAANIAGPDEMASVEYGVDRLETPLVVVLGHTRCGAIASVVDEAELPATTTEMLTDLRSLVFDTRQKQPKASDAEIVAAVARQNVFASMAALLQGSDVIAARARAGKARVVGALYDVQTGKIEWLGRHPDEATLLAPVADEDAGDAGKPRRSRRKAIAAARKEDDATSPIIFALIAGVSVLGGMIVGRFLR